MNAAIRVEALKLRRSPVGMIATVALVLGTVVLLAGITAGVAAGNPDMIAQAGPAASLDWMGLLAGAKQIVAAGGLIGFGVVLSWMFAREFTDGTITGLFALPVSRTSIALAKLIIYAIWVVLVSIGITISLLILGLLLGYGTPSTDTWASLAQLCVLALSTGAIAIPVAWVATITRSLLAAIGAVIGLVIIAQVGALAGAGAWVPLAAPAYWAMSDTSALTVIQLLLPMLLTLIFVILTCLSWARLQLNR